MEENKHSVSLERQVGILTLVGILLAQLIHPYCISVALLTGAGLMFADVTDTCDIRELLEKMPWHRISSRWLAPFYRPHSTSGNMIFTSGNMVLDR